MATKPKGKPVTDILSKASKALAKSRQLRDPGKTPVSITPKVILAPKKAGAVVSHEIVKAIKADSNFGLSSSDDDDTDFELLNEKSPSTFLEAMDNLYNSTAVSTRKTNKPIIGANVNIRSNEISDFSVKSDISSGTPSISLTISEKVPNSESNGKRLENLRSARGKLTVQSSNLDAENNNEELVAEKGEHIIPLEKICTTLEAVKLPASPVNSVPNFTVGNGHPHETVAALMKRGDGVSEETYRVLHMMVTNSEGADTIFEKKANFQEVLTASIEDALKTDASISMALEDDKEVDTEAPVSSESRTFAKGTIGDIVENLMSLEKEEETLSSNSNLEPDVFEFKADNIQEESCNFLEEDEEYEEEAEESMTLKEYLDEYESDFETETSRKVSSGKNTKSEVSRTNNTQQSVQSSKSAHESSGKLQSFLESENKTSKNSAKTQSTSRSEKLTTTSAKVNKSVLSSRKEVSTIHDVSSPHELEPNDEDVNSLSISVVKKVEMHQIPAKYSRYRESSAPKKKDTKDKSSVHFDKPRKEIIPLESESKDDTDEYKTRHHVPKSQHLSSKSKGNVVASKSRMPRKNPVEDLMNIDGEKSSRQRQKILSILRRELYDKELKRLTREQLKSERIQKRKDKEQKELDEEYRLLMNFHKSEMSQNIPDSFDSFGTGFNQVNHPGRSTETHPPHLSQMVTLMDKYKYAAAGLQNKVPSKTKTNINFGAPYFTRSGDLADGNFQPPETIDIPDLVQEVLNSHHRMYAMTMHAAKQMGKKYKEFLKEQNNQEKKSVPETKRKSSKVNFASSS